MSKSNWIAVICLAALVLGAPVGSAPGQKVSVVASADTCLEGRADLRLHNNGAEPFAVVGQNEEDDTTDCARALFRFELSKYRDLELTEDGVLVLKLRSAGQKLFGHAFKLYKMPAENADWVEGVGRHPTPGKRVEGVAWERKAGTHDKPLRWQGANHDMTDGATLIQSLGYGPGADIAPGQPLTFTIPKAVLGQGIKEGVISFLLSCTIEGKPTRGVARVNTREHETAAQRPRLSFGQGELLYNGIRLPLEWPPRLGQLNRELMRVPYLEQPPKLIPIDVGRQLFVDDFLIEKTSLERTFHQCEYHPANPVLKPEKPWETVRHPSTIAYSDGAWYDPADKLFKIWYQAPYGLPRKTYMGVSKDGIRWERPSFDVVPGTNAVLSDPEDAFRDSVTVWLDLFERDPARRFKLWRSTIKQKREDGKWLLNKKWLQLFFSPDGIHWTHAADSPGVGDRTTVFYNPFRKVWVMSIRSGYPDVGRARDYREHPDALAATDWTPEEQFKWTSVDKLDRPNPNAEFSHIPPQLYNLDAVAYESLMIGLFSVWQGDPRKLGHPRLRKRNEVLVAFSRDGFHWSRPKDRRPLAAVSEKPGTWNWGNCQSVGGCCLVVGDKLYFYISGRGVNEKMHADYVSTGLAVLRRDGFASMDAGSQPGTLITRPVRFKGKHLFVNLDAPQGELRVEALDEEDQPIEPFTRENCRPLSVDKTLAEVKWCGAKDLAALSGRAVKFRFHLRGGSLYSFWVSPNASGASGGYVAAGGPGFTGPTDTRGGRAASQTGATAPGEEPAPVGR